MPPTNATLHTAALLREAFHARPFTGADAHAAGISADRLRQAVHWGLVARVRRGWYVVPDALAREGEPRLDDVSPAVRDVDLPFIGSAAVATARELDEHGANPVIAGGLAARWWATDTAGGRGSSPRALILVAPGAGIRRGMRHRILIREAALDERDIVRTSSGLAFTSVTRTGIDCARGLDPASAFIVVNSAVRRSLDPSLPRSDGYRPASSRLTELACDPAASQEALAAFRSTLARCSGRGLTSVARIVHGIDPRLESALESLSWWRFGEHGLVMPTPQQWVQGASGRWYPVDFDFGTVIGEADGLGKYRNDLDVQVEKSRQMDIELRGRRVVRWGWEAMWHRPGSVIAALEHAAA